MPNGREQFTLAVFPLLNGPFKSLTLPLSFRLQPLVAMPARFVTATMQAPLARVNNESSPLPAVDSSRSLRSKIL